MSAVDPTIAVMQAVVVTPTQQDLPDPNMQCIQLILFSDGTESTEGQRVPLDLFGAIGELQTNLEILEEETEENFRLSDSYAPYSGGSPALAEGNSLQTALAKLEARVIALEEAP